MEAWIWMALEPVSRRIPALELSWTRRGITLPPIYSSRSSGIAMA
ncbi:MAG: hypothetical protein QXI39_04965 [Candidatus Bathyarchaeia archaeon]